VRNLVKALWVDMLVEKTPYKFPVNWTNRFYGHNKGKYCQGHKNQIKDKIHQNKKIEAHWAIRKYSYFMTVSAESINNAC
jgi:hypothetical protein